MASFNGLRSQTQSRRLMHRSAMMQKILKGYLEQTEKLEEHIRNDEIGTSSLDALQLIENIASDLTREVADWSTIYSKELPDT